MRPTCFVLNLRDRAIRMRAFESAARRAGMFVERLEAVDTRTIDRLEAVRKRVDPIALVNLSATLRRGHRERHEELTMGAIGCALSHATASEEGQRRGLNVLAVFEDDAEVPYDCSELIAEALHEVSVADADSDSSSAWDMILLGWWDRGMGWSASSGVNSSASGSGGNTARKVGKGSSRNATEEKGQGLLVRVGRFWGCHAYLVSARGMGLLAAAAGRPVRLQVDGALSEASARGDLVVLGVADPRRRVKQRALEGSDVQFPVRLRR